jgi:hypothetical protein
MRRSSSSYTPDLRDNGSENAKRARSDDSVGVPVQMHGFGDTIIVMGLKLDVPRGVVSLVGGLLLQLDLFRFVLVRGVDFVGTRV